MFSLSLKLAFKYFKSNKGGVFSFTSFLAITGLSIGVASLIIVMSVMNGFEKELQDRILGVVPHAVITADKPITNFSNLIDQIKIEPEILEAAPYISFQGLISSAVSNKGVSITGIDILTDDKMSIIHDYMKSGSIASLSETNSIIIGSWRRS